MDWAGIEEDLRAMFQESKDDLEGTAFATGTGSDQPYGIVTALTGTASEINAATDDAFAIADVYTLDSNLPPKYRMTTLDGDVSTSRASWIANHAIYNLVRQLDHHVGRRVEPRAHPRRLPVLRDLRPRGHERRVHPAPVPHQQQPAIRAARLVRLLARRGRLGQRRRLPPARRRVCGLRADRGEARLGPPLTPDKEHRWVTSRSRHLSPPAGASSRRAWSSTRRS